MNLRKKKVLQKLRNRIRKKLIERGYCPFCFYPLEKTGVKEVTHNFENKEGKECVEFKCICGRKFIYNLIVDEFSCQKPDDI